MIIGSKRRTNGEKAELSFWLGLVGEEKIRLSGLGAKRDLNLRPSGYEPDELPTAPPCNKEADKHGLFHDTASRKTQKLRHSRSSKPASFGIDFSTRIRKNAQAFPYVMAALEEITAYCDERAERTKVPDFPGGERLAGGQRRNRLQGRRGGGRGPGTISGGGRGGRRFPHRSSRALLDASAPLVGHAYEKVKLLLDHGLALYAPTFRWTDTPKSATTPFSPASWPRPCETFLPTKAWTWVSWQRATPRGRTCGPG